MTEKESSSSNCLCICFNSNGKHQSESEFLIDLSTQVHNGKKLRESFLQRFKHIEPYVGEFAFHDGCGILGHEFPSSEAVFLSLVYMAGYSYAGKFEKVAWSVAFKFKGVPFCFSLEKFGLRAYRHREHTPSDELIEEMLGVFKRGSSHESVRGIG